MIATIPDALHICPGCDHVTAGELYCAACRDVAKFYDERFARAEDPEYSEAGRGGALHGLIYGLLFEAWTAAMIVAAHYIWLHWK